MDKTWMNEIDAENLNEKYKEVFILYKKIGMTQKMVAEELDGLGKLPAVQIGGFKYSY